MMNIPACVQAALDSSTFGRVDQVAVRRALKELGVDDGCLFAKFYMQYMGPFGSKKYSHELLDLVDQEENILNSTHFCRQEYQFPDSIVVMTTMSGLSVFVLDVETNVVYDVDFEGGDEAVRRGELEPRWKQFGSFLEDYFC